MVVGLRVLRGRRVRRVVGGVLATAIASAIPAAQGVAMTAVPLKEPELGITWNFDCHESGQPVGYRLTPRSKDDDRLIVDVASPNGLKTYTMPAATWFFKFFDEESSSQGVRTRTIETGSLTFNSLKVGERVSARVRQLEPEGDANRWDWHLEITGMKSVDLGELGFVDVFVFEQKAFSEELGHTFSMILHYSPRLNFMTYWRESGSDGWLEECHLATRDGGKRSRRRW